jgi:hypothetical protein
MVETTATKMAKPPKVGTGLSCILRPSLGTSIADIEMAIFMDTGDIIRAITKGIAMQENVIILKICISVIIFYTVIYTLDAQARMAWSAASGLRCHSFASVHHYLQSGLIKYLYSKLIRISFVHNNFAYARVDYHLCAYGTGLMRNVYARPFYALTRGRSLYDGVLLSMQSAAKLMALARGYAELLSQTPSLLVAMGDALRCTVISRRHNLLVLNYNGTDLTTQTGGTLSRELSDAHEVFIPTRSLHCRISFH